MTTIVREHAVADRRQAECATHGSFEQVLWAMSPPSPAPMCKPFWSKCPACNSEIQAEQDVTNPLLSKELAEKLLADRMKAIGVPERFRTASVWNWQHGIPQQMNCWQWARDYCNGFAQAIESGRSGIFCGAPGTGKTHLGIGIAMHISGKGGTAFYTTAMDMLGRIKDTYNAKATETEAQALAHLSRVDLLVIDEVGRTLDTNYEQAQFFRLLDIRYRNVKPTLLITNLNKAKLLEFLGEPIVDRMREAGGVLLNFDWVGQRNAKRKVEGDDRPSVAAGGA